MAKLNIPGWTIKSTIGTGGQAHVFLAERAGQVGQQYALKVLKNNDQDSQAYGRFCREIDALKKLEHPNIVSVVEHAPEGTEGKLFYVMDYVPGAKSLKALIKEHTNPYKHDELAACRLFIQLASALEACEALGIVHRDLSPANVLIMPSGAGIKIIDFGICEMGGSERVTQTDENFGTLNYRAPECAPHSGRTFSVSTDLYSAGKIVWSALTDRQVFEREKQAFSNCSMKDMFPEHPNRWHLQRIFEKSIRLDPANRFQSAVQARVVAEQIFNLMTTHALPIEQLLNHCPICRMGKLVDPGRVVAVGSYILFGGQGQAQGVSSYVCDNCGYCFRICYERLNKTVKATREIE
jgi:serine/threonine protein kinase